jgi:hypothetical protein
MSTHDHYFSMEMKCRRAFIQYNAEKMHHLLNKRWSPGLLPVGYLMYLRLVENDIRKGRDGFTGKSIDSSAVRLYSYEKIKLCREIYDDSFCKEVEMILKELEDAPVEP